MTFARAIAQGDQAFVSRLLAAAPELALVRFAVGATRQAAEEFYLDEIDHYVYGGDTALHIAAAAYEADMVRELVDAGAITAAANRRGAAALHYAVDGIPGSARWNPVAQQATVLCLIELGADPNAGDKGGTTPLHRAVRNRCEGATSGDPPTPAGLWWNVTSQQLSHIRRARRGRGRAEGTVDETRSRDLERRPLRRVSSATSRPLWPAAKGDRLRHGVDVSRPARGVSAVLGCEPTRS